jgi:folate-binding protein YgfZ
MANPLFRLHQQAEAEFQNYAGTEIVLTFGEPQAEYAAIRKSAGIIDLAQRNVLELRGEDRPAFLNGLLTNQTWDKQRKAGLAAGAGVYSFLLNQKGRILADMNVLSLEGRTLLDMDVRMIEATKKELDKYLFREKVTMESGAERWHEFMLLGPDSREVLNRALATPIGQLPQLGSAPGHLLGQDVLVYRDDICGVSGYVLIVPVEAAVSIWTHFTSEPAGSRRGEDYRFGGLARPVGWAAFNSIRIEAGRPIFGIDFDDSVLPAETGQVARAVSFTKGCYVGQEIVARMQSRGQAARLLVGIRMEDDALPIAGAKMYDEQKNEIGGITSSTMSPLLSNAAIALGYVKKGFESPGTKVQVPAEGGMHVGVVSRLPFVTA